MDLAPVERAAFLDQSCGDDAALRHEVESLLATDDPMGSFLAIPAAVAAGVAPARRGAIGADSRRAPDPDTGNAFVAALADALAGRYTIGRQLGRGGMATVYLARDLRHDRPVALKVLLPELAAVLGTDRFLSEIRVTANLQHPHLLPLFDSGEAAEQLYYTMPYVEGESLRARLDRERQLRVDEAVRIAVAVAGALDYAHRNGVVHRDLKPENILLQDGQPVVADFGIALAVARAGGARVTQSGISLGTPHYMAPEQATADPHLDARADVYALGCVLYELLTGEPPHTGSNVQAVIAKILTDEARPVRAIRRAVPLHVEAAIATALEKLPADRWPTASAFAEALEGRVVATPTPSRGLRPGLRTMSGLGRLYERRFALLAIGMIFLFVVTAAGIQAGRWLERRSAPLPKALQFTLAPPEVRNLRLLGATLAPDGRSLAYFAPSGKLQGLYYRRLDELQARRLAETTDGFRGMVLSPDGSWIAFQEGSGALKKVPTNGGSPVTIATSLAGPSGALSIFGPATWTADNTIVLGSLSTGLFRMSAAGGVLEPLTSLDSARGERAHINPVALPNGTIAFSVLYSEQRRPARTGIVDLRTRSRSTLDLPGGAPRGYLDGRLLVGGDDHTLLAVPFDLDRGRLTGAPVTVLEDVLANPIMGNISASVSADGSLAYVRGREARRLVLVDERGDIVGGEEEERRDMFGARFSPDGQRVAVAANATGSRSAANDAVGIWVWDMATGAFSRVTTRGRAVRPAWTPDGRRIAYSAQIDGQRELWWVPADGSGPEERLYSADSLYLEWPEFSPDGRTVVFAASRSALGAPPFDLWVLQLDDTSGRSARPLFRTPFIEMQPRLSPDGKWIAYASDEAGGLDVFVRPFPGPGGRVQISSSGGQWPVWSRDGRRLLYAKGDTTISVTLAVPATSASSRTISVIARQPMFARSGPNRTGFINDIHPDGRRFATTVNAGEAPALVIVINWLTELRARIGSARQ